MDNIKLWASAKVAAVVAQALRCCAAELLIAAALWEAARGCGRE